MELQCFDLTESALKLSWWTREPEVGMLRLRDPNSFLTADLMDFQPLV